MYSKTKFTVINLRQPRIAAAYVQANAVINNERTIDSCNADINELIPQKLKVEQHYHEGRCPYIEYSLHLITGT